MVWPAVTLSTVTAAVVDWDREIYNQTIHHCLCTTVIGSCVQLSVIVCVQLSLPVYIVGNLHLFLCVIGSCVQLLAIVCVQPSLPMYIVGNRHLFLWGYDNTGKYLYIIFKLCGIMY